MLKSPDKCLKDRKDCSPMANAVSESEASYICCGENDGSNRSIEQDKYTLCIKSAGGVDSIQYCDIRDIIDQVSVMAQALSYIANEPLKEQPNENDQGSG